MERTITLATWLALVCGCGSPWSGEELFRPTAPPTATAPESPPPTAATTFTSVLGPSSPEQQLGLAIDLGGNAWVANSGVTEVSPAGAAKRSIPYVSLVAADRHGNVVLAGMFSSPIDLGLGLGTMTPDGDDDFFVVELDPKGDVVFGKTLGLCGEGLTSLAIAGDGRIGISGSGMGTAVLSPAGALQLQLTAYGKLAFDSHGNLVIAAGDAQTEPFLLAVDRNGTQVFEHVFDGNGVLMTGLTVDSSDHVIFVGYTLDYIDVFGTYVQAKSTDDSGRMTGAFLGELEGGWPSLGIDLGMVEANGVAVGPDGTIYVAGAQTSSTGFSRIAALGRLVSGVLVFLDKTATDGRDVAVAIDSRGNPLTAGIRLEAPTAPPTPGPIDAVAVKFPVP
jgi:hypothetical protein